MSGATHCSEQAQQLLEAALVDRLPGDEGSLSPLHCNPLACLVCRHPLQDPILLSCHHVFCKTCLPSGTLTCPLCGQVSGPGPADDNGDSTPMVLGDKYTNDNDTDDGLASFLVRSASEAAESCANCERAALHFCETCQQALCAECRLATHQAKMFAAHRLVGARERARPDQERLCAEHGQPFILYAQSGKRLVCVNCFRDAPTELRSQFVDLEVAYRSGCESLEKTTGKLKAFQQDLVDQTSLHRTLLRELDDSHKAQSAQVQQLCQQMIESLLEVRDRLLQSLSDERQRREAHFGDNLRRLALLYPSVQLYLLATSLVGASATHVDFLDLFGSLSRRITTLMAENKELKAQIDGRLDADAGAHFAKALEPFLGLGAMFRLPEQGGTTAGGSPRRSGRRSGSGYVNCPLGLAASPYQLLVDLAGAFGQTFARVEAPLRQFSINVASVGRDAQELQRDLTRRRSLVRVDRLDALLARGQHLADALAAHSALVQQTQPELQLLWQEQLDRTRRQQHIFRNAVESTLHLRDELSQMSAAAERLRPFALSLAGVACLADPRRERPPPAPLESICQQIQTLEPNSDHRISAIEKEEEKRRQRESEREKPSDKLTAAKRKLTHVSSKEAARPKTGGSGGGQSTTTVLRERTRRGDDPGVLSPGRRSHKHSTSSSAANNRDSLCSLSSDLSGIEDNGETVAILPAAADIEIASLSLGDDASEPLTKPVMEPVIVLLEPVDVQIAALSLANDTVVSANSEPDSEPVILTAAHQEPVREPVIVKVSTRGVEQASVNAKERLLENLVAVVPRFEAVEDTEP